MDTTTSNQADFISFTGVILWDMCSYAKKALQCQLVFGIRAEFYLEKVMQRGGNAQGFVPKLC